MVVQYLIVHTIKFGFLAQVIHIYFRKYGSFGFILLFRNLFIYVEMIFE